jgi:hypothetical protein
MTDKELKPLQTKATAYDSIVAAILKTNSELTEEDVTAELIIEAITSNSNATDTELQSKFDALQEEHNTLQSEKETLTTENTELKEQVTNLQGSAAEGEAIITSEGEASGKTGGLSDFSNKHKGDTAAILEQCKKEGII